MNKKNKVKTNKKITRKAPIKNKRMVVECQRIDDAGRGIVEIYDQEVPVPNLLAGERAIIEVIKKPQHLTAKVVKIKKSAPGRVKPKCHLAADCGGCQLQHMSAAMQQELKENAVKKLLGKYGPVNEIIAMDEPYDYRNKIHSTFTYGQGGKIISGMYEQHSHWVLPVERCYIQDPVADQIIATIRSLMVKLRIKPFNEDTGEGFMRHVLIRTGQQSRQIMVVLVASSTEFPQRNNFISALLKKHSEINTIVLNINNSKTNLVLGQEQQVLYGEGFIQDTLCGCVFQISAKSFYQVNPIQAEKLYRKVIEMADFKGTEVVLDAYSGIGTIALIISSHVSRVIGVELSRTAVKDAIKNAKLNQIENVRFYRGDAGSTMLEMAKARKSIDTVILDPPRSGCDERFLTAIQELKPQKVIYISCNPATQARDIAVLVKGGYQVGEIQPLDMFPQTHHIEVVVELQRNEYMK